MKIKKIFLGVLALVSVLTLAAYGSSSSEDLQEKIVKKGELIVAISPNYAPFEFKALANGKNTTAGTDVGLVQTIADELDVKLELSSMSFNSVLSSLRTGEADVAISGLPYTGEHAKVYNFSDAYYEAENAISIKTSDVDIYTSVDSLSGLEVAVQKGTIERDLAKDQLPNPNIASLTAMGEAINGLKSGRVQVVDLEKPVAGSYPSQDSDLVLASFALETGKGGARAVAMPKDGGELVRMANKVTKKLVKEDRYKQFASDTAQLTGDVVDEDR